MDTNDDTKREKVLLHMDGDAFFVAVEVAKDQKLKGLPVVTGAERGIVSALSYEAKALGIIRGMPIYRVRKDYPSVIIMHGDYKAYAKYSRAMFAIVRRYSDDVEEYSIDECFADLTGLDKPLKMTYREIAERIKKEVNEELKLSVTIGLAPTKVLAKVASKWVKPNGLTIIEADKALDFLSTFPIENIWGMGRRTAAKLQQISIDTAAEFAKKDYAWVREKFASNYVVLWQELNGIPVMPVNREVKSTYSSIQRTRTFHPATNDATFLLAQLSSHIEQACMKARQYNLTPKKFMFLLRKQTLRYSVHTVNLDNPTNAPEILIAFIKEKWGEVYVKGIAYRATGVVLQNLTNLETPQTKLFEDDSKAGKFEQIHKQIDALEHKLGKRVVHLGSTQSAMKNMTEDINPGDGERHLLFT